MVFLLKILCRVDSLGKYRSTSLKKWLITSGSRFYPGFLISEEKCLAGVKNDLLIVI